MSAARGSSGLCTCPLLCSRAQFCTVSVHWARGQSPCFAAVQMETQHGPHQGTRMSLCHRPVNTSMATAVSEPSARLVGGTSLFLPPALTNQPLRPRRVPRAESTEVSCSPSPWRAWTLRVFAAQGLCLQWLPLPVPSQPVYGWAQQNIPEVPGCGLTSRMCPAVCEQTRALGTRYKVAHSL